MTAYTCITCGAGGGSGKPDLESPMSYNCHACGGKGTMWYRPHADAYRKLATSKHQHPQGPLYTCIGKGGRYELLGRSLGAGERRLDRVVVYRDTETGLLYHRSMDDFDARMALLAEGEA